LNYRHAFHAGNFGDVLKHLVLVNILQRLLAKDKPFSYLDVHAGRGLYDLEALAARTTGESEQGIRRLLGVRGLPPLCRLYRDVLHAMPGNQRGVRWYPGSPLIAQALMREQDRAIVVELQPQEAQALEKCLGADKRFCVHQRDGWEALKALLPPSPRRGLLLLDPAFELEGEFQRLIDGMLHAARVWPVGIVAAWYPIKRGRDLRWVYRALSSAAPGPVLRVELCPFPDDTPGRMNGSGLFVLNPPWQMDKDIGIWLPTVGSLLAGGPPHRAKADWLVAPI
jgi:23S rRNA (adenine2030-N6)-methyltransferase